MAEPYNTQATRLVRGLSAQLQHLEAAQSRLAANYERDLSALIERVAALDSRTETVLLILQQFANARGGPLFPPHTGGTSPPAYPRSQDQWAERLARLARYGDSFQ